MTVVSISLQRHSNYAIIEFVVLCLRNSGPTFSKLLRKILGRFLILGKSLENIEQSINLELGNNNAIIIVINSFIFAFCWTLLRDVVVKS